jgi:iron-sulfur cluster repair protein YtfE (RIC family)
MTAHTTMLLSARPTTTARRPRIDATWTVDEVLRRHAAAVAVFNAFGVDVCCGGGASLGEAALHARVARDVLVEALERVVFPVAGATAATTGDDVR